jgi:uncharacterized OB-fold protein
MTDKLTPIECEACGAVAYGEQPSCPLCTDDQEDDYWENDGEPVL